MKSAISLALVVALITSAVPVVAQQWIDPAAGPIHRAMTSAAFRFAADDVTPPVTHADLPGGGSARSDWSRVMGIEPGSRIDLTIHGSPPGRRYFVGANALGLTVLNLTDPAIPTELAEGLQDRAWERPDDILRAQQGVTLPLAHGQLSAEGLFSGVRWIAGLDEVVEQVARNDVEEIVLREKAIGRHVARGALIGAGVGFAVLYLGQRSYCRQHSCSEYTPLTVGLVFGMPFGGGIGSGVGAVIGAVLPPAKDLIYRAP